MVAPYTIIHLTPENNAQVAQDLTEQHAVSFSGGIPSAEVVERVIRKYGREHVLIWFADVKTEDADLYRFIDDCMTRWGGTLYYYTDGRTPLDVAQEKKLIPCDLHCPCSYDLKVKAFRQFIQAMPSLPTVYIGLEPWEVKRLASVTKSYAQAIPQAIVEYPLLWEPQEERPFTQVCREDWGIEPPRLYTWGFKHNNCGGACVRQGVKEWVRLGYYKPELYAQYEQWEQEQRAQGGPRASRSFCSVQRNGKKQAITLAQIRAEYFPQSHKLLKIAELPR